MKETQTQVENQVIQEIETLIEKKNNDSPEAENEEDVFIRIKAQIAEKNSSRNRLGTACHYRFASSGLPEIKDNLTSNVESQFSFGDKKNMNRTI